jgi:hypothetical protein
VSFDNSRFTFDPWKDYSGVVMEQGRVQTDADWNEWLAELSRRIQAGTLDTMGRAVYPVTTPYAFQITPGTTGPNSLQIGVGRIYIDGLLVENHGDPAKAVWDPALAELSGSPQPPPTSPVAIDIGSQPYGAGELPAAGSGAYVAYLDVWKRPVTFLEDSSLVDVAIGVDTSGRVQTAWRVGLIPVKEGSGIGCGSSDSDLGLPSSSGLLSNGTITSGPSGPCCLTTGTGYTGVENQFYRVEIHQDGRSGGTGPTFKWSRENASVQTSVTEIQGGSNSLGNPANVLTVLSLGRDQVLGFAAGNWVEISNQTLDNACRAGELYQIDSVDVAGSSVTLTTLLSATFPATSIAANSYTRICRWDQSGKILKSDQTIYIDLDAIGAGSLPNGCAGIPVPTDGSKIILEGGLVIDFSLASPGGNYLAMDYWNFATRTADGSYDKLASATPRGIHHHYTTLSVVTFAATVSATDCRTPWTPSSGGDGDSGCCCTCTVGDGKESFGKYTSINAALKALPAKGGEVCILPGHYYEHVVLRGLHNVVMHGCAWQTHIYSPSLGDVPPDVNAPASPAKSGLAAVITVVACNHIELRSFEVHAADDEVGIRLDRGVAGGPTENQPAAVFERESRLRLVGNKDTAIEEIILSASTLPAIIAVGVAGLKISENRVAMRNVDSRWAAVYLCGIEMLFERNWVGLTNAREVITRNPSPNPNQGPAGPAAPKIAELDVSSETGGFTAIAPGGIHIAGPSRNVFILENEIIGGRGNGITLGNFIILDENGTDTSTITGVTVEPEQPCSPGGSGLIPGTTTTGGTTHRLAAGGLIRNLHIDRNRILHMGMCGIGPVGFFNLYETLEVINIINLSITENIIANTLMRTLSPFLAKVSVFGYGAISLPDVENLIIRDNTITNFGASAGAEVCGIFVLHGELIEISRNQIRETRDWEGRSRTPVTSIGGVRAGIMILMATPPPIGPLVTASDEEREANKSFLAVSKRPIYTPGLPSLRIQENVIRVAIGLALSANGYGPFSIVDNHFSTGGPVAVRVENPSAAVFEAPTVASSGTTAGALTVSILNLGLAIEVLTPATSFSQIFGAKASLEQEPALPVDSGGAVLFTNNICQLETRASHVRGLCSVGILSLDHVLFANNHLWVDGPTLTALVDAFLFGLTMQTCTNRLQEVQKYPVLYSGSTYGLLNMTSQNVSSYCLKMLGPAGSIIDTPNLIANSTLCRRVRVTKRNKVTDTVAAKG